MCAYCQAIGVLKQSLGCPPVDVRREQALVHRLQKQNRGPLGHRSIHVVYRAILHELHRLQQIHLEGARTAAVQIAKDALQRQVRRYRMREEPGQFTRGCMLQQLTTASSPANSAFPSTTSQRPAAAGGQSRAH